MTRATGGSAWAATSTRSRFLPYAYSRASSVVLIPSCSPSTPIRRTRGTRIASLMRVWGSGLRGASNPPERLRGLKCLSPSSCCPPCRTKKPLACSGAESRQPASVEPPSFSPGGERRLRPCLPGTKGSKFGLEIPERERLLRPSVLPDRERLVRLLVPVDDHVRDLVDLGVADPLPDRVVGRVDLDPVGLEPARELGRCEPMALADRDHPDLHRCEPERE